MADILEAVRRLADWWPVDATISPATGWPTCIQSTKLLIDACAAAGLGELRPTACQLVTMNPAGVEAIETNRSVPGSCRVEVGPDSPTARREPNPKRRGVAGWWGHLIAEHDDFLVDLVYEGVLAANKAPGFPGVGAFCARKGDEVQWVDHQWVAMTEDRVFIAYKPLPALTGWQDSEAWTGDLEPGLLDLVVAVLRDEPTAPWP